MAVNRDIIQKLLPLLRPLMEDKKERKAYLTRALINTPILNRLDWDLTVDTFITDMIMKLDNFGEIIAGTPALCAVLKEITPDIGLEQQPLLEEITRELLTQQTLIKLPTSPDLLFDLLLTMNFKKQVRLFKQILESHRTAAFLVHGEPDCGQDLLVTRLFRLTRTWKNNSPIKNDVTHNAAYRSVDSLRKQLARSFLLSPDTPLSEICEKICDRWQTKDVILIFDKVDCMPPQVLGEWLQQFWELLVTTAKLNTPQQETHLLMFLIDNCGSVCTSTTLQVNLFHQLPPVSPFPPDILDDWIDNMTSMQSIQIPAGLNTQVLMQKSENGYPQFVYEEICCHCGHSWEGGLAKWLI